MEQEKYPMRINKYLALRKYASRREADKLIEAGQVKINGRAAKLGDRVSESDEVEVNSKAVENIQSKLIYIAYNKPHGIVTNNPEEGQEAITDVIDVGVKVFPIGRLDRSSRGLIILTNDGRITDQMLNPKYEHEKEYIVKVDKPLEKHFLRHLGTGIDIEIEGHMTKPAVVKQIGDSTFRITLVEGKKHQIRRMCAAFGYTVINLQRVRIMGIKLGNLKEGEYRILEGRELENFLESVGL